MQQLFNRFTNINKEDANADYDKKKEAQERKLLEPAPENLDYDPEGLRDIIEDEGEDEGEEELISVKEHPLKSKKEDRFKKARMVFEEPSYGSLKHIQALERHPEIKQGDVITWFNTYWKTIDSWAIGMYFIKLLHTHQTTPHIINQYLKSDEIRKMVRGLCIIDPKKRWTCMQALYYLHPNSPMITDRKLIRAHHKKMTSASV